ncbi:Methyltransf 8 domain containing protein, partial [Asbolus verrucosus]
FSSKKKNKSILSGKVVKKSKKKRKIKENKQKIKKVVHRTVENNDIVIRNKKFSKINKPVFKKEKSSEEILTKRKKQNKNKNDNKRQISEQLKENSKQHKHKNRQKKKNANESLVQQNKHTNANDVSLNKETNKLDYKQKKRKKLQEKLHQTLDTHSSSFSVQKQTTKSLRAKMMEKLQAARFRYINEQIYSNDSKEAQKLFSKDPESFHAYHEGYRRQVNKWPLNPVDIITESVQKMPKSHIIADFGCGDAKLAKSVEHTVHSFDLISTNELVTACDMAHVPLQNNSVDVVVFCLSLMGTNLHDYFLEANRVLKQGGILKIAEVESRFDDVHQFIEGLRKFHFKNIWKDLSHNLFYFLDFKKEANIKKKKKLPTISLHPCLYKKR